VTLIKAWDNWDAARGAVDLTLDTEDQKLVDSMQLSVAANEAGAAEGTHLCVWRDTAAIFLLSEAPAAQVRTASALAQLRPNSESVALSTTVALCSMPG
jgi:hypothetical protein